MKISRLIVLSNILLSLFCPMAMADLLLISDIDDTVKQTNSEGKAAKVYHFFKNKPFPHTRDMLNQLIEQKQSAGEKVTVVYVSAAYEFMFNAQKFIKKNNLPQGQSFLRKLNSGDTFTFKYLTISKLIKDAGPEVDVLLLGDNSEHDHDVYWQIKRDIAPAANVFVRDVATWAHPFSPELEVRKIDGINFFMSERDLLMNPYFSFVSLDLKEKIMADFQSKKLVPKYTTKTLSNRLIKLKQCLQKASLDKVFQCRRSAKREAITLMDQYYQATAI
jgi:hypothetical protein